jgi:hypothetical protein
MEEPIYPTPLLILFRLSAFIKRIKNLQQDIYRKVKNPLKGKRYKQMYKIKSIIKSILPPGIVKFIRSIRKKSKITIAKKKSDINYFPLSIKKWYGNEYGGFYICPDLLLSKDNRKIIVYSCGIGEDISFDTAIMNNYNCEIFAFDPTPKSIEWIKKQNLPDNFIFSPYGVSDKTEKKLLHLSNTPLDYKRFNICAWLYIHRRPHYCPDEELRRHCSGTSSRLC